MKAIEQRVAAAMSALQARDYAAVEAHARGVLAEDPAHYDALHFLALAAFHDGRLETALERLDALDRHHPRDPYALNTRGAVLQAMRRLDEAERAYRDGAECSPPQYGDAWMNLGSVLTMLGRPAEAVAALRKAEPARGNDLQLKIYLAVALFECGEIVAAEARFRDLVGALPTNPTLHANHAAALLRCGRDLEAAEAARRAIAIDPRLPLGWELLVAALLHSGDPAGADREAQAAQAAGVDTVKLSLNQALARLKRDDNEGAAMASRRAVQLDPSNAEAVGIDAYTRLGSSDLEGALAEYGRVRSLAPGQARWRFLEAIACPPVFDSEARMASRLAEAEAALQKLEKEPGVLTDPYREVGTTPFYFAYLGLDDTRLQRLFARCCLGACPSLGEAGYTAWRRDRGRRIRLGIASMNLRNHSIGKLNLGFVEHLDRRRFEVIVIRPPAPADEISGLFDRAADRVVTLPWNGPAARAQVGALGLDALFYPDIGMDAFIYFLAFGRLAPLQFTTWGHPVTTGIPNMDVFLSSRHVEPEGSQRFYHERLVAFENLPSFYYRPRAASSFDIRAQLGVGARTRLYACPQTIYKFHPHFDLALGELLRRDPDGMALIIAGRQRPWQERLVARMRRAIPDVVERIRFVPSMTLPDFFAMLRDADALLDPFHFGGGTSSYEALSVGIPVVTLPAAMMRGRITAGWYSMMGEDRWVASSVPDFVERAVALAHAPDRARIRAELAERSRVLVENPAVVRELEAFVESELEALAGR